MEMDDWWFGWKGFTPERPCPGKVVLMVGAGISIESPTLLPDGEALTEALLDHLLDSSAASEIKKVFSQCKQWMGRSLPRLEHVLDKAFEPLSARIKNAEVNDNIFRLTVEITANHIITDTLSLANQAVDILV
ncbi:hypothetical protein [Candidatus Symbiopectobacterium sp. NZEC135]|uniref:hypothetical protein n=1 Tax=Candidatus Symbiopectobacterium sp. NZEC135 TaxID=2820471 RepID=UPI002226F453|nr:hypothetical protein [Candidatus Symbiopectobacterium sp. NZEC135]